MNSVFSQVELKMIDVLMKKSVGVSKRYSDKKTYLKELVNALYSQNH